MLIINKKFDMESFCFTLVPDKNEKDYELIRFSELFYDFLRKPLCSYRPYAIRVNSTGGENIATSDESFVETVVDIVYKLTRFNYYNTREDIKSVKIFLNSKVLTMGMLKDELIQRGVTSNIAENDTSVLIHSQLDTLELEILFDNIPFEEHDVEEVFIRNKTNKLNYYPCFITSDYGISYVLNDDCSLSVTIKLCSSEPLEIIQGTLVSIIDTFSELGS